MAVADNIKKGLENISGGFHAVQPIPSSHRLFNILGMVIGFSATKYIADIMFGCKVNGGNYEKINKEDVPFLLKPLHNSLEYNPFSDKPKDQWRKVAHQMMPAVGGAVGAIGGSGFYFNNRGITNQVNQLREKSNLSESEKAAIESFDKGKKFRLGAGATAWLSAASGLTWFYGFFLNKAFLLCNIKRPTIAQKISTTTNGNVVTKTITETTSGAFDKSPTETFIGIKPLQHLYAGINKFFSHNSTKVGVGLAAGGAAIAGLTSSDAIAAVKNAKDMSAEDYVKSKMQKQETAKPKGAFDGNILDFFKWVGNAALAVVPVHRMWTAIGLTVGGKIGLEVGSVLTGKKLLDNSSIGKDNAFSLLRPLHGLLGSGKLGLNEETSKLAGKMVYATGLGLGAFLGSSHAYHDNRDKDKKAESLEDFTAKISHTHGHNIFGRMAVAASALFGSGSGMYLLPVPGENYGMNLAMRTVSEQDRKIIAPGLSGLTGNSTNSYMGVREALNYLSLYAIHNPDKQPKDLEFLAHTIMGPLADSAGVQLNGEHIKKFVDKVNEVRDDFWQEGGIPEDKKKELMAEMKAHFRGKGFDKTLYECGIDSLEIKFDKVGGIIGKVANFMGSKSTILKDQEKYHELVKEWRKDWQETASQPQEKPEKISNTYTPPLTPNTEDWLGEPKTIHQHHAKEELHKNITPVAKSKPDQLATESMKKPLPIKETSLLERAMPAANETAYSMQA